MNYDQIINNLSIIGQMTRAKISYDLNVEFNPFNFFKDKFYKEQMDAKKICKVIFKIN